MIMRTPLELSQFTTVELINHFERCRRAYERMLRDEPGLITECDQEYLKLCIKALAARGLTVKCDSVYMPDESLAEALSHYNHGVSVEQEQ